MLLSYKFHENCWLGKGKRKKKKSVDHRGRKVESSQDLQHSRSWLCQRMCSLLPSRSELKEMGVSRVIKAVIERK